MAEADPITRLNAALEGRYCIERDLGEGGMATVYLADDLKHERKVALKVLKPELAAVVGAGRFLAEIKTTANLQHPHILGLHDSGEADGLLFYVMPYVEGESLRDRLGREHQLPVDDAVRIATNLAEALDYAHRQGVIHRDIKPANVLLQDGKPVISDFGIALALSASGGNRITETGLSLGTPHYMSPEQATGDQSVGPATDIWGLGCVLYEMLVGEPPFTGSTPQAVLGRIITGKRPSATEHRATVPSHVEAVLVRALQKVPADRFGSAAEMAGALGDPSFRAVGDPRRPTGAGRPSPSWGALTGVSVLAVAAGVALGRAREAPPTPQLRHTEIVAEVPARGTGGQIVDISADGLRVVYIGYSGDDLSARVVYYRPASEAAAVPVEATRGATEVLLAPDGSSIAFVVDDSELLRVSSGGGRAERIAELDGTGFLGGAWGADGRIIYATRKGIHEVSIADGRTTRWTSINEDSAVVHRQPRFLPDGDGVVFTVTDLNAAPGEEHMLSVMHEPGVATPLSPGHSPRVTADGYLLFSSSSSGRSAEISAVPWRGSLPVTPEGRRRVLGDVSMYTGGGMPTVTFAVSDEGTLVYMPEDARRRGVLRTTQRGPEAALQTLFDDRDPRLPAGAVGFGYPSLSPDGARVAFSVRYTTSPSPRLFVYEFARGTLTPVTVEGSADGPVWTPDGERLAFVRDVEGAHDLYWKRADNVGVEEPLVPPNAEREQPMAFTPDGGAILVERLKEVGASEDSDIWLLTLGDSVAATPVRATNSFERHPSLSPDGRWMAFGSDSPELGYEQIYVTDVPAGERQVLLSTEPAFAPVWVGDEIFFFTEGALMSVPVSIEGGNFRAVDEPRPVRTGGPYYSCCPFGRSYDVVLDGQFQVWLGTGRSPAVPRIGVLQGWVGRMQDVP